MSRNQKARHQSVLNPCDDDVRWIALVGLPFGPRRLARVSSDSPAATFLEWPPGPGRVSLRIPGHGSSVTLERKRRTRKQPFAFFTPVLLELKQMPDFAGEDHHRRSADTNSGKQHKQRNSHRWAGMIYRSDTRKYVADIRSASMLTLSGPIIWAYMACRAQSRHRCTFNEDGRIASKSAHRKARRRRGPSWSLPRCS